MIRQFFSSFSLVLLGLGCAFLTHVFFARVLTASEYGVYSFIFSISLLISVFALFGFQNASVKIISLFESEDEAKSKTKEFCKFSVLYCVFLAVLVALIVYTALSFTDLRAEYPKQAMALGFVITPLMVLMRLHAAFLRGMSKSALSVLFETTMREILLLGFLIVLFLSDFVFKTGVEALMVLFAALFVTSFLSWITAWHHINKRAGSNSKKKLYKRKEWLKLSFPMMLIIFAQRLLRRSDIIILGFMTSPMIVGAYAIAAQFSEASSMGQKGVFAIFAPKAAKLHADGKSADLRLLYRKMQFFGAVSTGILCVCIALAAPYVLQFFGADFQIAYNSILILIVGQFVNVCIGPVGILMLMTGREKQAMALTFIAALLNIILNPFAIYFYGMEGAATISACLIVLRNLANYIDVKKNRII